MSTAQAGRRQQSEGPEHTRPEAAEKPRGLALKYDNTNAALTDDQVSELVDGWRQQDWTDG